MERTRTGRRNDVTGELLGPDDSRALVPYQDRPREPAPLVHISLPSPRPSDAAPFLEHERRTPARAPSFESDVSVPFWQAVLTGFAFGVLASVLALLFGWPWEVAAVTFGAVFALTWVSRMRLADSLLWQVERITGYDVNGDNTIGAPHPPVLVNPSEARADVARNGQDETVNAEKDELVKFLHRCYTSGTSETAHGIARGSGSARDDYCRRRDLLISLGIAQWKNPSRPSAGWKLAVSHERAAQLLQKHVLGGL